MRVKTLIAAGCVSGLFAAVATADVGSKVNDWFENMNYANVTTPGVYEGQGARYATLGGIYARAPITDTFSFVNVQSPRLSAGCGGIDFYTGGFSAIDADQFVENLRAIGENAKSLAFMLAIQIVSPQLAGKMKEINDWAQKINQFNMNSCDAAMSLVGGALEYAGVKEGNCITKRMNEFGEDYTTANDKCTTGGGVKEAEASGGDANMVDFVKGNIAWYMLMQDPYFRGDIAYSELVMNLVGTRILTDADSADDGPTNRRAIPPALVEGNGDRAAAIIDALLNGSNNAASLKIWKCALPVTATPDSCLGIDAEPTDVPITWDGLYERVERLLTSIVSKTYSDTPLTDEEKGFIRASELPIFRFITASVARFPSGALANSQVQQYGQFIANDILNRSLRSTIERLEYRIDNPMKPLEGPLVKSYRDDIRLVRQKLEADFKENRRTAQSFLEMNETIRLFEREVATRVGQGLIQSATWSP